MKSIHDLEDSFSDKSLWWSIKLHVCIYFRKKTWSHMLCLLYLYKENTRHFNVECLESAVPAIFLSYAPTFFGFTGKPNNKSNIR